MVKTEIKTSDGTTTKRVKREATDDVDEEDCQEKNEEVAKITPMKNNEGDSFFELSGKRRCTVRKWNNNILIDIREVGIIKPKIVIDRFESSFSTSFNASYVYFIRNGQTYEKDGKTLPGKKGISLSLDQYKTLRDLISSGSIDSVIADIGGKK